MQKGNKPTGCLNHSKQAFREEILCNGNVKTLDARNKKVTEVPLNAAICAVTPGACPPLRRARRTEVNA